MRNFLYIFIFIFLSFFILPNISEAATSVSQYGITWTFDKNYTVGQFVNGDYWVLDPGDGVRITDISPGYTTHPTTGRAMNGSMINPATALQGYDGFMSYSEEKMSESGYRKVIHWCFLEINLWFLQSVMILAAIWGEAIMLAMSKLPLS